MKINYDTLYIVLFIISICLNYKAFGQHNRAKLFPDRIIINLAEDASTSIAVTWRTDLNTKEDFCELQSIMPSRINPMSTQSYKAKTTRVKCEYDGELFDEFKIKKWINGKSEFIELHTKINSFQMME